jgi:hypothetical protein
VVEAATEVWMAANPHLRIEMWGTRLVAMKDLTAR